MEAPVFCVGARPLVVLTSFLSQSCPLFFPLGTSTDYEVPVPLRAQLIPERVDVGSSLRSALWKETVESLLIGSALLQNTCWPTPSFLSPQQMTYGLPGQPLRALPSQAYLSRVVAETRTQRTFKASRQFNVQPHLAGNCSWAPQWRLQGQHRTVCTTGND